MKKILFLLWCNFAFAINIPPVPKTYVSDISNVLVNPNLLNTKLYSLNKDYSCQVVILTIQTLEGVDIADYANTVFNNWGIGQKGSNNGILIVVAVKDHKMRIEVGYGLESTITDFKAREILDNYMKPNFRLNDYDTGLNQAVDAITREIIKYQHDNVPVWKAEQEKIAAANTEKFITNFWYTIAILIIFSLIFIYVYLVYNSNKNIELLYSKIKKNIKEYKNWCEQNNIVLTESSLFEKYFYLNACTSKIKFVYFPYSEEDIISNLEKHLNGFVLLFSHYKNSLDTKKDILQLQNKITELDNVWSIPILVETIKILAMKIEEISIENPNNITSIVSEFDSINKLYHYQSYNHENYTFLKNEISKSITEYKEHPKYSLLEKTFNTIKFKIKNPSPDIIYKDLVSDYKFIIDEIRNDYRLLKEGLSTFENNINTIKKILKKEINPLFDISFSYDVSPLEKKYSEIKTSWNIDNIAKIKEISTYFSSELNKVLAWETNLSNQEIKYNNYIQSITDKLYKCNTLIRECSSYDTYSIRNKKEVLNKLTEKFDDKKFNSLKTLEEEIITLQKQLKSILDDLEEKERKKRIEQKRITAYSYSTNSYSSSKSSSNSSYDFSSGGGSSGGGGSSSDW